MPGGGSLEAMWRLLGLLILVSVTGPLAAEETAKLRPWTFAHVMAYDNDLSIHAETILSRIADGVGKSEIAVTDRRHRARGHG